MQFTSKLGCITSLHRAPHLGDGLMLNLRVEEMGAHGRAEVFFSIEDLKKINSHISAYLELNDDTDLRDLGEDVTTHPLVNMYVHPEEDARLCGYHRGLGKWATDNPHTGRRDQECLRKHDPVIEEDE